MEGVHSVSIRNFRQGADKGSGRRNSPSRVTGQSRVRVSALRPRGVEAKCEISVQFLTFSRTKFSMY